MSTNTSEYNREWRKKNHNKIKAYRKKPYNKWKPLTPVQKDARLESERRRRREYKNAIYDILGGKCVRCGFDDERALQIDHIDGKGNDERKIRGSGTLTFYKHVIEVKGKGYQILCANCNWIKRSENLSERGGKLRT